MSQKFQQLPVGSLPMAVREKLDELLQKDLGSLMPSEVDFLKARRMYLSADQRAFYGLDEEKEPELLSRPALKARLKELGVEYNGNSSNEELKKLVDEAEAGLKEEGDEEDEPEMLSKTKAKAELKKLGVEFEDDASQEELNELLTEARANA